MNQEGLLEYFNALENHSSHGDKHPLFVDLDGTLIQTDLLQEGVLRLLKKNFLFLFCLPYWLLKGKAYLKTQISLRTAVNPQTLPYNETLIHHLKQSSTQRPIYLATGSPEIWAQSVFKENPYFSNYISTTSSQNLVSENKLRQMTAMSSHFYYIGNSSDDIPILEKSQLGLLISPSQTLFDKIKNPQVRWQPVDFKKFKTLRLFIKSLRMHQWVKNLLIFIPMIASHQIFNLKYIYESGLAFIAFSVLASGVYVLNDLMDIDADRSHHSKKNRPFASGQLPIIYGLTSAIFLPIIAYSLAWQLNIHFIWGLSAYYLTTIFYTFYLKRVIILDAITLAVLYTLRIVCGHLVTGVSYSSWLFAFSIFLFLSLAFIKRYTELARSHKPQGRGYSSDDKPIVSQFGITSGYLSILVFAFYISSPEVKILYRSPEALWICCLFLLYWISRLWLLTGQNKMHDDPIVFAVKDKTSYVVLTLILIVVFYAK